MIVPKEIAGQNLHPILSNFETSTNDEYRVAFHLTSTPAGVDSPVINQPQNTGLAAYVSDYTATKFSNSDRASSGLKQFAIKIPASAISEPINMGYGIQGKWFS